VAKGASKSHRQPVIAHLTANGISNFLTSQSPIVNCEAEKCMHLDRVATAPQSIKAFWNLGHLDLDHDHSPAQARRGPRPATPRSMIQTQRGPICQGHGMETCIQNGFPTLTCSSCRCDAGAHSPGSPAQGSRILHQPCSATLPRTSSHGISTTTFGLDEYQDIDDDLSAFIEL